MAPILDIYVRDAAYFQRLLDFLLISRFRSVRLSIQGHESACVFLSSEGEVVDFHDKRTRYATLTEWFNVVCGTQHDQTYVGMFGKIMATRRVNLMQILMTVKDEELRNFKDMRYKASLIYAFLQRRMQLCGLHAESAQLRIPVLWKNRSYYVEPQTITTIGGDLDEFMQVMCGKESDIHNVYYLPDNAPSILLTAQKEKVDMDFLQTLHRVEKEENAKQVEALTQRIEEQAQVISQLSEQVTALLEGQKVLHSQYTNVMVILGTLVRPMPPMVPQVTQYQQQPQHHQYYSVPGQGYYG